MPENEEVTVKVKAEKSVKPGYKTTEFWMSAVVVILGLVMASGAVGEATMASQIIGGVLAALGTLGYGADRAKTKAAAEK